MKAYYEILQVDKDVYDLFSKIKKKFMLYIINIVEDIVQVLIAPIMARLVVKLRIPLNLVEDNNYYCKEPKNPEGLYQARTLSLIVI